MPGGIIHIIPFEVSDSVFLTAFTRGLAALTGAEVRLTRRTINYLGTYSAERNQFYSTKMLAEAAAVVAGLTGKVLMITDFDLFVPVFTFVYGEAQLNGQLAVMSLCRLHEEFYTGRSNPGLLLERALKEAMHELGHTYGLIHCKDWNCVMHASSEIEEVDIKGGVYCQACAASITAEA